MGFVVGWVWFGEGGLGSTGADISSTKTFPSSFLFGAIPHPIRGRVATDWERAGLGESRGRERAVELCR